MGEAAELMLDGYADPETGEWTDKMHKECGIYIPWQKIKKRKASRKRKYKLRERVNHAIKVLEREGYKSKMVCEGNGHLRVGEWNFLALHGAIKHSSDYRFRVDKGYKGIQKFISLLKKYGENFPCSEVRIHYFIEKLKAGKLYTRKSSSGVRAARS